MTGSFPGRTGFALLLAAWTAHAGPFSDELSGVAGTGLVHRAWISAVVSYEPGPTPGSGGSAKDDASLTTSVSNAVIGRPLDFTFGGVTRHYASLGNGGRITVTFPLSISDGPGPDFAVFENGFTDPTDWAGTTREGATNSFSFAELASVEVSSDLQSWAKFPITCLNTDPLFVATYAEESRYASQDVTGLDGLAGKHAIDQGTPFDLAALTNHPAVTNGSVNLALVRYVRLTDVVGDGSVTDVAGRAVFDPFYNYLLPGLEPATPYTTEGFDLRGVAVLNAGEATIARTAGGPAISCDGVAHTVYQLQGAPIPDPASWSPLSTVTGRGERITWTNAPGTNCFFRVARWPSP